MFLHLFEYPHISNRCILYKITLGLKVTLPVAKDLLPVHFAADVVEEGVGIAEGTGFKVKKSPVI